MKGNKGKGEKKTKQNKKHRDPDKHSKSTSRAHQQLPTYIEEK